MGRRSLLLVSLASVTVLMSAACSSGSHPAASSTPAGATSSSPPPASSSSAAAPSPLSAAPAADILRRSRDAALAAGAVHEHATTTSGPDRSVFDQDDLTDRGIQRISVDAFRGVVIVLPGATYVSGNDAALTQYFGYPKADLSVLSGRWLRLTPDDVGYDAPTSSVTLPSSFDGVEVDAPLTVLPVTTKDGQAAVGVRGRIRPPAGHVAPPAVATLWVSDSATDPLPIEYDASSADMTLTNVFTHWGTKAPVTAPTSFVTPADLPAPLVGSNGAPGGGTT